MEPSQPGVTASGEFLFRPRPLLLRVLQDGGARGEVFTYQQVLFHLDAYIQARGLWDSVQLHVVRCAHDPLGDLLGVASFSVWEHRKLWTMMCRHLVEVAPPEASSPPGAKAEAGDPHESGSELKESAGDPQQDPRQDPLPPSMSLRPSTSSERSLPTEAEDNVAEFVCAPPRSPQRPQSPLSLLISLGGSWPGLSPPGLAASMTSALGSMEDMWEEHPSHIVDTRLSTSSRRRPLSETDVDVDTVPCEQPGSLLRSEGSPHTYGGCSGSSDLFSEGSHSSLSVAVSSRPDEDVASLSDQFSVEYEVESELSDEHSMNEEEEEEDDNDLGLAPEDSWMCGVCKPGGSDEMEEEELSPPPSHTEIPGLGNGDVGAEATAEAPAAEAPAAEAPAAEAPAAEAPGTPSSSPSLLEPCILCLSQPKNGCIVHGVTGHLVTCYTCARKLQRRNKPCPVCRQPIHLTVLIYLI